MPSPQKIEKLYSAAPSPNLSRWNKWLLDRVSQGKREVFSEQVEVGPALAELLMGLNKGNRPVSELTVQLYARQMKEGRWRLSGETIIVSQTGRLLDGQHRLKAIHDSAVIVPAIIVFGVDDDAQALLDTGKKRTAGDVFVLKGVQSGTALAAATSWICQLEKGQQLRSAALRLTNEEIYEQFLKHPKIQGSLKIVNQARTLKLLPPGLVVALHFLFSRNDPTLADRFFEQLLTGVGFSETDDPTYVLYHRLVDNLNSKARLSPWYIAALTIKAWNRSRRGDPIKALRWAMDEEFPVIE